MGRSVGIEVNIYRQEPMAYRLLSIVNHDLKNLISFLFLSIQLGVISTVHSQEMILWPLR